MTNQTPESVQDVFALLNSYSHPLCCKHGITLLELWEDMTWSNRSDSIYLKSVRAVIKQLLLL